MVECDKKNRFSDNDPCSECRWFGRASGRCSLAIDTSYNDQLFARMLSRRDYGYTIGEPASRDAPRKDRKGILYNPTPMPNDRIKHDWMGETKEQLLAKSDMLPPYVRQFPRAYLDSPRASTPAHIKKTEIHKRKADELDAPAMSHMASTASMKSADLPRVSRRPRFPPPLSFQRPPADAQQGEVLATS